MKIDTSSLAGDSSQARVLVTGGSGFIGTHAIEALRSRALSVWNIDLRSPSNTRQADSWVDGDILDRDRLERQVRDIAPTHVLHLAARTDMDGVTVEDYATNFEGTSNLLGALRAVGSARRVVLTSTQFVCGPGVQVVDDETFGPHTVYGQSKVEMERLVRAESWPFAWTVVRPTNVWGPWHPRYPNEFWRVLRRGLYVHPGREPVIRGYGYVGNVASQMLRVFELARETIDGRVFYVGDLPVPLLTWVGAFARGITGREPRIVPRPLVRGMALAGDVLTGVGLPFPITSSRYQSMTQDYRPPMEASLAVLGSGPFTLEDGVRETLDWLREHEGWAV